MGRHADGGRDLVMGRWIAAALMRQCVAQERRAHRQCGGGGGGAGGAGDDGGPAYAQSLYCCTLFSIPWTPILHHEDLLMRRLI